MSCRVIHDMQMHTSMIAEVEVLAHDNHWWCTLIVLPERKKIESRTYRVLACINLKVEDNITLQYR